MKKPGLHIEKHSSFCGVDVFLIRGLTEAETWTILNAPDEGKDKRDVLATLLDTHTNDYQPGRLGTTWRCGNGIYAVQKWRNQLLVEVGRSCD